VRLYLDAAPVIYLVERVSPWVGAVEARFRTPGLVLVASDLTRLECRVHPLRRGDAALLAEFNQFFAAAVRETVPLRAEILDRATEIRAAYGFRTPDAIHLAAAEVAGCDAVYTNDHRLDHFTGLAIEVLAVPPSATGQP
jgi:predicted nucleic acid-binding protein